jgi:hypothetical protein
VKDLIIGFILVMSITIAGVWVTANSTPYSRESELCEKIHRIVESKEVACFLYQESIHIAVHIRNASRVATSLANKFKAIRQLNKTIFLIEIREQDIE